MNPVRGQMLYRHSDYYRLYNQRVIIPRQFFQQDIMIGPGDPVVIYNRGSSPFNAPWVDPVVILKPAPAASTSGPDIAEQFSDWTGRPAIFIAKATRPRKSNQEKEADALEIAKTFVVDGIAPSVKNHATAVMGILKERFPNNHIRKTPELEDLLAANFKRRPVGRTKGSR